MVFSREQRRKGDRAEAITARRQSGEMLQQAETAVEAAERKLRYNKSDDIRLQLLRVADELKEIRQTLTDSEYDPD